jgi:hypothetical protein
MISTRSVYSCPPLQGNNRQRNAIGSAGDAPSTVRQVEVDNRRVWNVRCKGIRYAFEIVYVTVEFDDEVRRSLDEDARKGGTVWGKIKKSCSAVMLLLNLATTTIDTVKDLIQVFDHPRLAAPTTPGKEDQPAAPTHSVQTSDHLEEA